MIRTIEPPPTWPSLNFAELWRYRDLLYMLVWRDISINYRQSVVGYGWALFRPLLSLGVFSVIFGRVAKLPSDGIPYPVFCLCGMIPWMYFAGSLSGSISSVVNAGNLLTKVYFPRLLLPLTSILSGLMDFAVQFVLLLIMAYLFNVPLAPKIVLVPGIMVLCMLTALSVGLWLTALNVRYRDVGQLVPFLTQMWMWMTPVVYPSSLVSESWRWLYGLNPMVGVVELFRWTVISTPPPDGLMVTVSFAVVSLLFSAGLYFFRRTETTFADVI